MNFTATWKSSRKRYEEVHSEIRAQSVVRKEEEGQTIRTLRKIPLQMCVFSSVGFEPADHGAQGRTDSSRSLFQVQTRGHRLR